MASRITPFFGVDLVAQAESKAMAIRRSPSTSLIDSKEKQAHSLLPARKVKKSKGASLPLDVILGPSEVLIAKVIAKDGASLVMARATSIGAGKALKEIEEGTVTIIEAQAKANEA